MLATLWIRHERLDAHDILQCWIKDLTGKTEELLAIISILPQDLVAGLDDDESSAVMIRVRSQGLLSDIVDAATGMLEVDRRQTIPGQIHANATRQCENILDMACIHLRLAFQTDQDEQTGNVPLSTTGILRLLEETFDILMKISQHAHPRAIYYLLQMAERFILASPERTFEIAAHALTKGDSRHALRLESLIMDSFARLVGVFLADHKTIFRGDARRADLMRCLDCFAAAGWPEAQRLLYRLPELIR